MLTNQARVFAGKIVQAFDDIINDVSHLNIPKGEGSERALRTYLKDRLFVTELDWLPSKLIYGELLDLYAYDLINYIVLYIETKTPNSVSISEEEILKFERRLRNIGTCEFGIITNGHKFTVYRCFVLSGNAKIEKQYSFDLDVLRREMKDGLSDSSVGAIADAFSNFKYSVYLGDLKEPFSSEYGQATPTPGDINSLQVFSKHLKEAVDELNNVFEPFMEALYKNRIKIGGTASEEFTIDEPLSDWSTYSGKVPPSLMFRVIVESIQTLVQIRLKGDMSDAVVRRTAYELKKSLGINLTEHVLNSLITSAIVDKGLIESNIREKIFTLIRSEHLSVYSRQTAHVVLSRILLQRLSEDKNLVPRRLSEEYVDRYIEDLHGLLMANESNRAFIDLIDQTDALMERVFYSHLYAHGIFDWWRIPQNVQETLIDSDKALVLRYQRAINLSFLKVLRILNRFNLKAIERDVWKDIYQNYLPPNERSRLGGFYTPDEIVTLILDLVGYKADVENLCKMTILDPACGSGTFAVEATKRLRQHLEGPLPCHSYITNTSDVRERSWRILETVINNIHGIDIHPFACFLTEMNFLFVSVDLLLKSKQLDPTRRIGQLNFGCDDSLRPAEEKMQLSLTPFVSSNSRAETVVRDKAKANKIKQMKFSFVVGNPPWSGVLRGTLSPLFDENTKAVYKKKYSSTTDKYDIYVLFLERGFNWIEESGTLGMITQNRYFRRKYGRGIRAVVRKQCNAKYLLDLGYVGKTLFSGRSNYPAISVYSLLSTKTDSFLFLETKKASKQLKIDCLVSDIGNNSRVDSESLFSRSFTLSQKVLRQDPILPWSLTPPETSVIKKKIYSAKNCISLGRVCHTVQGVTPGGTSLDVFLIDNTIAQELEQECLRPAIEADDVNGWTRSAQDKWLIYPYDGATQAMNFGSLDINLTQEKAVQEIERRIVSGEILYPKTAMYLATKFSRLSQRSFEKKTLREFGKKWYEYHRPRNGKLLCTAPKIVTRRMTKNVEFQLDVRGVLPTDGCIAIIVRSANPFIENLLSLGMERQNAQDITRLFLLAVLNSKITKFLLKSSADFWQGGFYQVRKEFLEGIPIKSPDKSNLLHIKEIASLSDLVIKGDSSKIGQIEEKLLELYDIHSKQNEIQKYLQER